MPYPPQPTVLDETYYISIGVNLQPVIDQIGRPLDVVLMWNLRMLNNERVTKWSGKMIYYPMVF